MLELLSGFKSILVCHWLSIYLNHIRESVNYESSAENSVRDIVVFYAQGIKLGKALQLRDLNKAVDIVI